MECKYCNESHFIKKGVRKGIQRYYCKVCKKYFQKTYKYKAYSLETNRMLKQLLKESCGIRSISRVLNISCGTVLSRMLKISNEIKAPYFNKQGCKFEVDEMWTYIKRKEDFTWITYAIERETKSVIDFFVGSKSKNNLRPLINKVLLLSPKTVYTDRLNIYPALIPKAIHKRFQYCTNKIERMNLTLRTHIKRLSR